MKKLVAAGAVAASLLVAATPALAQDAVAVDEGIAYGGDVQYVDASQLGFALQGQFGSAVAADGSYAVVASYQGVTINQANAGLGEGGNIGGGYFFY